MKFKVVREFKENTKTLDMGKFPTLKEALIVAGKYQAHKSIGKAAQHWVEAKGTRHYPALVNPK